MIAAAHRGLRVMEVLANSEQADVSVTDALGRTVAHHAVHSAQRSVLEMLATTFEVDFNQQYVMC